MIAALSLPETGSFILIIIYYLYELMIILEHAYFIVPHHMKTSLRHYTQQGYRVIALAYRNLEIENFIKIQRLTREQVEVDLVFLGLIVLENRLKPESSAVIAELHQANIKVVMITGH